MTGSGGLSQAFGVFEHLLLLQWGGEESTTVHHCRNMIGGKAYGIASGVLCEEAQPGLFLILFCLHVAAFCRAGQSFVMNDAVLWSTNMVCGFLKLSLSSSSLVVSAARLKGWWRWCLVITAYFAKTSSGFPTPGKGRSYFLTLVLGGGREENRR